MTVLKADNLEKIILETKHLKNIIYGKVITILKRTRTVNTVRSTRSGQPGQVKQVLFNQVWSARSGQHGPNADMEGGGEGDPRIYLAVLASEFYYIISYSHGYSTDIIVHKIKMNIKFI